VTGYEEVLTRDAWAALKETVRRLSYPVVDPERPEGGIAQNEIVSAILARPWRRTSACKITLNTINAKVQSSIEAGDPIEFSIPFGGYKSWRQSSFPHLDWAELFWVDYLRSYAERMAKLHAPGVVISLSYVGGVLEWMNNLPCGSQLTYISELQELLNIRSSARIRFRLVDHAEAYGGAEHVLDILKQREQLVPTPSPAEIASAKRNLFLGDLENPLLCDDVAADRAARRCSALLSLERRREFNKMGPRIQLTHIRGSNGSVHIGSCRSAIAQPWVSTGYMEWREQEGGWIERLATSRQQIDGLRTANVDHALMNLSPFLRTIPVKLFKAECSSQ
jgi:hypothetical protein